MKVEEQIKELEKFQKAFKGTFNTKPTLISQQDWELRLALSQEELNEYKEACENEDLVEVLDSILDRIFLAIGDAVSHGLQDAIVPGFQEVMRSNMSKLGVDGQPIINGENGIFDVTRPLGKVLKPSHYSEPNLKQFL